MAAYSKQGLLDELKKGDAMHGWGAILAIGRDRINQLLQMRFAESFSTQDFFEPISGEYEMENRTEKVVFDGLMFGPAQLTFKHASGRTAQVTVRMELIAGTCSAIAQFPGVPHWLRRSHVLQQGMGYQLEMTASLSAVPLPFSERSQLILELGTASAPTCNLGVTDVARRAMGDFLLQQLKQQRLPGWHLPVMTLDRLGYSALSLVDFTVLTQKAPEGGGGGISAEDDGALLLLMQLRGTVRGDVPDALPYLLPAQGEGLDNYGAALLIGKARAPLLRDRAAALLACVVLPENHYAVMSEEHEPHDSILFGDIQPSAATRDLQPSLSTTSAGAQVNFTINGAPLSASSVRNLIHPLACGEIDKGRYTASAVDQFATEQQLVLVTVPLTDEAQGEVRTALLVESSEPLSISPRVVLWSKGDGPVRLSTSRADGVKWTLEGGSHGSLESDPEGARHTRFVPKEESGAGEVLLQRIKVTQGTESGYATVVILNYTPVLSVEPFHVQRMPPSGTQVFTLTDYPATNWMLFGAGKVDASSGEYTAPEADAGDVSVLAGIAGNIAGFAVIEHQRNSPRRMAARQERWRALNLFEVKRNNVNRNRVLANGLQQVGIDIVIETKSFEGEYGPVWDPVSDLELSTLVLLYENGDEVTYLPEGVEGLPSDSEQKWAASKVRNRFDYLPAASSPMAQEQTLAPADARRTVTVYVNALEAEVRRFKAKFQDHNNGWHFSDVLDLTRGVVELEGVKIPSPSPANYTFEPKRVATKSGSNHGTPPDTFNYWHYTTDYWVLSGRDMQFLSVRFDHVSMIKWESEQLNESYCSYTGVAFKPRRYKDAVEAPASITYQAELELLSLHPSVMFSELDYAFKGQESVSEGALLLSLDRVPNLAYWYDMGVYRYREVLDKPLLFTLTDNYGVAHKLKVAYGSGTDGRNMLTLELQ